MIEVCFNRRGQLRRTLIARRIRTWRLDCIAPCRHVFRERFAAAGKLGSPRRLVRSAGCRQAPAAAATDEQTHAIAIKCAASLVDDFERGPSERPGPCRAAHQFQRSIVEAAGCTKASQFVAGVKVGRHVGQRRREVKPSLARVRVGAGRHPQFDRRHSP
jgi:hypothetical protein